MWSSSSFAINFHSHSDFYSKWIKYYSFHGRSFIAIFDVCILDRSVSQQNKKLKGANVNALLDSPSGFQRYVVEMAIFVDYALYNR